MDRIICQLHEKLLIHVLLWVEVLVLLRAGPDVALLVLVDLAVCRVQEHPLANVELTVKVEQRLLDEFLDHEGVVFVLLIGSIALLDLSDVGRVVVIMGLEDRLLVTVASADAIVVAHNIP